MTEEVVGQLLKRGQELQKRAKDRASNWQAVGKRWEGPEDENKNNVPNLGLSRVPPQRRGANCKSIGESIANRWEGLEDSRKNKIVAYLHVIPECLNRESSGFRSVL